MSVEQPWTLKCTIESSLSKMDAAIHAHTKVGLDGFAELPYTAFLARACARAQVYSPLQTCGTIFHPAVFVKKPGR